MKALFNLEIRVLIISILIVSMKSYAQTEFEDCSDLFISEIVFDNPVYFPKSESFVKVDQNNVIELYNPTQEIIDLSLYSIVLIPEVGDSIVLNLSGSVAPESTALISSFNANSEIISVAEVISSLVDFTNKVKIELKKDSIIKDCIGQVNSSNQEAVQIDLDYLLSNPIYLNGEYIDLTSIASLNIRRKVNIRKGTTDFNTETFIDEWLVYPNSSLSDLGYHLTTCNYMVGNNYVTITGENMIIIENSEDTARFKFRSGGLSQLGNGSGVIKNMVFDLIIHPDYLPSATPYIDFIPFEQYDLVYEVYPQSVLTNTPTNICYYDLLKVIDDSIIEGNENVTFLPDIKPSPISDLGISYFIIGWEVVILDDDDPNNPIANDNYSKDLISVYPTLTRNQIYIQSKVDFVKGWITNELGGVVKYFKQDDYSIDLSFLPSGYYSLHFYSDKFYHSCKIIKL